MRRSAVHDDVERRKRQNSYRHPGQPPGAPAVRLGGRTTAALHPGLIVEVVEIKTQGDRDRNTPLAAIGGIGLFTKEIQRAVQDGSVDVAVHSLKDLPTQGPVDLVLAAVPPREDVADALIAPRYRTVDGLPAGAGRDQLAEAPGAIALLPAGAGGRDDPGQRRDPAEPRPRRPARRRRAGLGRVEAAGARRPRDASDDAAGVLAGGRAGVLGIECRRDDPAVRALLEPLDDPATHRAVRAERAVLAELEGGCVIPMAAWARDVEGDENEPDRRVLAIDAVVFDPDGLDRVAVALRGSYDDPDDLGRAAARELRDQGAERLLKRERPTAPGPDS